MPKLVIDGAIGSLNTDNFTDRIKKKKDYFSSYYNGLKAQNNSAVKLSQRSFNRSAILCMVAVFLPDLYPEVNTRLLVLVLAFCVLLPLGFDLCSALMTLRKLKRLIREAVIMKDEFLNQIQIFRGSDAGQSKGTELFVMLPDFSSVTRGSYFKIWLNFAMTVHMFLLVAIGLLPL